MIIIIITVNKFIHFNFAIKIKLKKLKCLSMKLFLNSEREKKAIITVEFTLLIDLCLTPHRQHKGVSSMLVTKMYCWILPR